MEKRIGILHLSDTHVRQSNIDNISRLIQLLINDATTLQNTYHTKIECICITGDVISSGDNSAVELSLAFDKVITPLMDAFGISAERIFVVPGNHEVKRTAIDHIIETGLKHSLTSEAEIERYISRGDIPGLNRISYFDSEFSSLFGGTPIKSTPYYHSHILTLGNIQFGFACFNSAWRSTGIGGKEKGCMILGRKNIIDGLESISEAEVKVCMMHHPLDWFLDEDKSYIEKCIGGFNLVLNGHIHESNAKMTTTFNGQSLYNTCGKLDNSEDIYNGYSLLSIDPVSKNCDIILRKYNDYPRNSYDKALHLSETGIFSAPLGNKDDTLSLAYRVAHSIEDKFSKHAKSFLVPNLISSQTFPSSKDSFFEPTLSAFSEYEKETSFGKSDNNKSISFHDFCLDESNVLLMGRKEIGKTTILRYVAKYYISNFNTLKKVPVMINCESCPHEGQNAILKEGLRFLQEFCGNDDTISQNNLSKLLENGLCIVLFDNFDSASSKVRQRVSQFIDMYPGNRFIFTETELIGARAVREVVAEPPCTYKKLHVCALTKGQIRTIAKTYISDFNTQDDSLLVDKILQCFRKTALPRTPFVLSLIMSICSTSDFTPINEATVMERFMESILGKTKSEEIVANQFDFKNKEDFLIHLVSLMHQKNRYYFTETEFEKALFDYLTPLGYTVRETGFDKTFFDNGVLIKVFDKITFRYSCMVEYYLAKKAVEDHAFLEHMLSNRNFVNYSSELQYYTGLNRKDSTVLSTIQIELESMICNLSSTPFSLGNYNIGLDISIPDDDFSQKIDKTRLSQVESDRISTPVDYSEVTPPEEIDKELDHTLKSEFISTLLILGTCIKHLELVPQKERAIAYSCYINGLQLLLSLLSELTTEAIEKTIAELNAEGNDRNSDEITQKKELLNDIIKIALPIIVQNIALDNVGSAKIRAILSNSIESSENDSFEKFFSLFIFCDLRIDGLMKKMTEYVNSVGNKALQKIIFFKLMYYYRFGYFSTSLDSKILELLADLNIKNSNGNKFKKTRVMKQLEAERKQISFKRNGHDVRQ